MKVSILKFKGKQRNNYYNLKNKNKEIRSVLPKLFQLNLQVTGKKERNEKKKFYSKIFSK